MVEIVPRRPGCPAWIPPSFCSKWDPAPRFFDAQPIAVLFVPLGRMRKGAHLTVERSRRVPQHTIHFQDMTTEQEIKDHTRKIEAGAHRCYCQACPHCAVEPERPFRVHQCRRRTFRVLVKCYVRVYRSWVLRLKCPHCKRTFTDYPPFCFALQAVRQPERARESEGVSGDRRVLPENRPPSAPIPGV